LTTYTTIANGDIDQDSPVTQPLMTALRDNPLAIAEGDATAPSLLPAIAAKTAAGGVGTYVFARRGTGTTDVAFGSTVAGSDLVPTSALSWSTTGGMNGNTLAAGSVLSGTWRAMGTYDYQDAVASYSTIYGATLWLRIA